MKILKSKKIYILIIVIVIISTIAFSMGYRIPEWDKHRDWIFIPQNKDSFFEIEKTDIEADIVLQIPNSQQDILFVKLGDSIQATLTTEKGRRIREIIKTKDFYIDSLNQRFIFSKEIFKNDTLFEKQYIGVSFSDDYKMERLVPEDFILEETQSEFLKRKNYPQTSNPTDEEKERLDTAYIKEKTKEIDFYRTLYPITKIRSGNETDTEFYADAKGKLYTVGKTKVKSDDIHDMWHSLYLLFPRYNKDVDLKTFERRSFAYEKAEEPTIEGNFIHTQFLEISIRQDETEYYRVKFGDRYFNFKYKNKMMAFPTPVYLPKNNKDTLSYISDGQLYWVYPKANKLR